MFPFTFSAGRPRSQAVLPLTGNAVVSPCRSCGDSSVLATTSLSSRVCSSARGTTVAVVRSQGRRRHCRRNSTEGNGLQFCFKCRNFGSLRTLPSNSAAVLSVRLLSVPWTPRRRCAGSGRRAAACWDPPAGTVCGQRRLRSRAPETLTERRAAASLPGGFPLVFCCSGQILAIPLRFLILLVSNGRLFSQRHDLRPGGLTDIAVNRQRSAANSFLLTGANALEQRGGPLRL